MKTKKTLKETVVEGIYREIEEGIYKPNDIIHEGEIMEKYAMSKSPVREALIELCKDNVLKSIPRVGYQVVPVTLKEILDLLEFRIDVETANLRRLSQRISPEEIERLRQLDTRLWMKQRQTALHSYLWVTVLPTQQRYLTARCRLRWRLWDTTMYSSVPLRVNRKKPPAKLLLKASKKLVIRKSSFVL